MPGPVARMRAYGHDRGLTNEQAALRHVAVLAAGASTLEDVFSAAVLEASALLGGTMTTLLRCDELPDDRDRRRVHRLGRGSAPVSRSSRTRSRLASTHGLAQASKTRRARGRGTDRRRRHAVGHPGGRVDGPTRAVRHRRAAL